MDATEQIISDTIQDLDANAETTDSTDTSGVEASAPEESSAVDAEDAPAEPEAQEQSAEQPAEPDALLKEFSRKRNNRIPYSRVEKIVAKAREEAKTAALAEANAIKERYAQYETDDFRGTLEALRVAGENPERFLSALAEADPRYAELIRSYQGQQESVGRAETQPAADIRPDVVLPDGSYGYSLEAFDQLVNTSVNARVKAAEAELERRFTERFGPIEQSFRQANLYRGAVERVQDQIADAETWPGFNDNKEGITAALKADRSLGLEQAYRKVVLPKLAASRDEIRKQLLAEINAKPRASQARPSAGASTVDSEPRDIDQIIRDTMRGMR